MYRARCSQNFQFRTLCTSIGLTFGSWVSKEQLVLSMSRKSRFLHLPRKIKSLPKTFSNPKFFVQVLFRINLVFINLFLILIPIFVLFFSTEILRCFGRRIQHGRRGFQLSWFYYVFSVKYDSAVNIIRVTLRLFDNYLFDRKTHICSSLFVLKLGMAVCRCYKLIKVCIPMQRISLALQHRNHNKDEFLYCVCKLHKFDIE